MRLPGGLVVWKQSPHVVGSYHPQILPDQSRLISPRVWEHSVSRTRTGVWSYSLTFWRCPSGDLDRGDVGGVCLELRARRPKMLLHVSGVAWSGLNPLPEKEEPLVVLSLSWDLIG